MPLLMWEIVVVRVTEQKFNLFTGMKMLKYASGNGTSHEFMEVMVAVAGIEINIYKQHIPTPDSLQHENIRQEPDVRLSYGIVF